MHFVWNVQPILVLVMVIRIILNKIKKKKHINAEAKFKNEEKKKMSDFF